jgi:hypothetical protein
MCPIRSSDFLLSSRSAKPAFRELDCSKADVAELTQPAIIGIQRFFTEAAIDMDEYPSA